MELPRSLTAAFVSRKIEPTLDQYARIVLAAVERAHGGTEKEVSLQEVITDVFEDDEGDPDVNDGEVSDTNRITVKSEIPPFAMYDETGITGCPSIIGSDLCAGLLGARLFNPDLVRSTDPLRLIGAERIADAALLVQKLHARCGHLWAPLVRYLLGVRTFEQIGDDNGGNSASAGPIGREKVRDALMFCRDVIDGQDQTPRPANDNYRRRIPDLAVRNAIIRHAAYAKVTAA
jgi:hypothetical protein